MEVTFRSRTLSEVSHGNTIVASDAEIVAGAGGLGDLRAEGRRDGDNVHVARTVMDRHLLALAQVILIASQLVAHLLDGETAPKEGTSFTILGEDQVGVVKGCSSANTRSLFTKLCHVE